MELVSELTENLSIMQNNKKMLFDVRSKLIAEKYDVDVELKTDSEVRPLQNIFYLGTANKNSLICTVWKI